MTTPRFSFEAARPKEYSANHDGTRTLTPNDANSYLHVQ